jgi:hypothetical protein
MVPRTGFLSRFEGASCPAKLLEEITIIDTPGVLSGEKQRIERNYNVSRQCVALFRTLCLVIQQCGVDQGPVCFEDAAGRQNTGFQRTLWCAGPGHVQLSA